LAKYSCGASAVLSALAFNHNTQPDKCAIGDEELLALGHQPQIGVDVFIDLVVHHKDDADSFGLVGEEVILCGRKAAYVKNFSILHNMHPGI